MISALRHHQTISRLALLAAVLLCAWQTINAQHIHADELDAPCVVCATSHHDDDAVLESSPESLQSQPAAILQIGFAPCPRAVSEYRQGPRAPPAN